MPRGFPQEMKRVAIIQPNYIPWKGYFDVIAMVDEFILYDDAPYNKNSWRNRNCIKTRKGTAWLTIPVLTSGRFGQPIREVRVANPLWPSKHWKTLRQAYARAQHFEELAPVLKNLYDRAAEEPLLFRVNRLFLEGLCGLLGIQARLSSSGDYELLGDRTGRLVGLCRQVGASEYLSGPAARAYLDESQFADAGIEVRWMSYEGYPVYRQLHTPPFVHEVTVLDLLFTEGPAGARRFLLSAGIPVPSAAGS
jgi:hypothetical protein